MQDSAKYLIHADIRASGVVERSDVVGAIFGQTEGLLGDDLDLRDLQESSKIGRIDVQIDSEGGRSFGTVTIASGLDKVETAVLAAGLETIDRVGPCRAEFDITELEDARAAKRRTVVERATELLAEFEETTLSTTELVEQVRQNVRVAHISEYEGLPAGPRVADSDAIILVEGRADVTTLLQYGIKNAVAVEGTNIPEAVADLTHDRTVTAFLDGDRGGDLILKELTQVGAVDYVAFAPDGRSVEDLSRSDVLAALRKKVSADEITEQPSPHESLPDEPDPPPDNTGDHTTDESGAVDPTDEGASADGGSAVADNDAADTAVTQTSQQPPTADQHVTEDHPAEPATPEQAGTGGTDAPASEDATTAEQAAEGSETLADHVRAVIGDGTDQLRLLDDDLTILAEKPADEAFETLEGADTVPSAVVLDGELTQRILDVAAQRGVGQIVAADLGEFVKQPVDVRVRVGADV